LSPDTAIKIQTKINFKGGGQECPPHTGSDISLQRVHSIDVDITLSCITINFIPRLSGLMF
jgi:hypothetical protein